MCGRISLFAELGDLAAQFQFNAYRFGAAYQPSWNITPTGQLIAVVPEGGRRAAAIMRWGFTFNSQRSKTGSSRPLFNARSETITQRPDFRDAFARRRCLVLVNGFYEWRSENGVKTPLWIHRADETPFALAGIYAAGREPAVCVVTCAPNSLMQPIHDRMPVMLDAGDYNVWLDAETRPETLQGLLIPKEWPEWPARPVSPAVNRAGNDGPHLIVTDAASPTLL